MNLYLVFRKDHQPLVVIDPGFDCDMTEVWVIAGCSEDNFECNTSDCRLITLAIKQILSRVEALEMLPSRVFAFNLMADIFESTLPAYLISEWKNGRNKAAQQLLSSASTPTVNL
ncbi:MAG: hypothetical protein UW68_C0064G0008 [Candidatus Collierbacteria bacterium GW2011_GWB1_44_6]|uniref:Uncharacterized protein n=2 Tax=Candidatus Collieribacteriota TaxID=1752725 RepID=A0A0G1LRM7_9BACT|nr:MAG: hypothetical protein UV68_C0072G0004 [Candidatus Collierbacteria bacterium GW2011_GWC2_43_12]KKT71487.1 MAG: hypothetical protein UW68_C0064G0008 [Candidatus Collierbacteria bacterium GW2011_GWB1_44_6]